jgi:outer membrane murein-binding lipoprotein Lpp
MKEYFTLTRFPNFALAVIIACALAGCATYSKVSERHPRFRPIGSEVGRLANVHEAIAKACQWVGGLLV